MSAYDVIVFVHVTAAIVLVGGSIVVTPAIRSWIGRARTVTEIRRWAIAGKPLSVINPVSSMGLLATGIYLASVGGWWRTGWVQVAVVLWITNSLLASGVVKPGMARLGAVLAGASGDDITPEIETARNSRKVAVTQDLMLANDIGVVFLMITKPMGYLRPIAAVATAAVVLLAYHMVRRAGGAALEAGADAPEAAAPTHAHR